VRKVSKVFHKIELKAIGELPIFKSNSVTKIYSK
jgi:hypothetical protein